MTQAFVLSVAHRGARGLAPENTIPAFEKARRLGADLAELDVHLSADGEVVVVHDDDLLRCSDAVRRFPERVSFAVSAFTLDDIRRLDAGSWFVTELEQPAPRRQPYLRGLLPEEKRGYIDDQDLGLYRSGDVHPPTLAECLETAARAGLALDIELKTIPRRYPGIAEKVVRLIEAFALERQALVSSFDHVQLAEVRRLSPVIATGVLTSNRLYDPVAYLARLDADVYLPSCSGPTDTLGFGSVTGTLDLEMIRTVREAGFSVIAWTENDPARMRALVAAGVSGIATDYLNRLGAVLTDMKAARPRDEQVRLRRR